MKKKEINLDILRKLYVDERLSSVKIAKKMDVSSTTILKALKDNGIIRPPLLCDDKAWLKRQYIELNKSCRTISEENNIKKHIVSSRIKRFKLTKSKEDITAEAKRVRSKTNLEKFGHKNPFQNQGVKDAIRESFMSKYGVDHPMKDPTYRERVEASNLKRYGVKTTLLDSQVKVKSAETNLKKYGTPIPQQSDTVKSRTRKTNLEAYGVEHFYQSEEFKASAAETNLKRYGVKNPMLNAEVKSRALASRVKGNSAETSEVSGEKGSHKLIFGVPAFVVAEKNKIPYNTFNQWLNRRIFPLSKEDLEVYLEGYRSNDTSIEMTLSRALNLPRHNKKFDKKRYPDLNYKPDFKLSDKIAVNVDGLYWHSEKFKDKRYHFKMRKDFESHGLHMLQFREDEIDNKLEIVKSIIMAKSGKISKRHFARKLNLVEVSNSDARVFLDKTHLKGHLDAKHIGLKSGNDLIMIMSYKIYSSRLKIERLSCKLNTIVTGGFSKLLKFLEKKFSDNIRHVDYWVDLRYGTGNFLSKLGFSAERETLGFEWTDTYHVHNRLRCVANNNGNGKTEAESGKELGWVKIYDAGQRLWTKELR
jgi:very-short-patch-repair endonuclease/predicted DNA-binding protein YlxM (UPF0122 family)